MLRLSRGYVVWAVYVCWAEWACLNCKSVGVPGEVYINLESCHRKGP
jgi:hypothetical protein